MYLSEHAALAVLEVRVHLDLPPELLPDDYALIQAELPDEPPDAVANTPDDPRTVGNEWLEAGRTAVLRVPSYLVPTTTNLLLNPRHPRAAEARVREVVPFAFDPRLWVSAMRPRRSST